MNLSSNDRIKPSFDDVPDACAELFNTYGFQFRKEDKPEKIQGAL
jgi:hypothetical protein